MSLIFLWLIRSPLFLFQKRISQPATPLPPPQHQEESGEKQPGSANTHKVNAVLRTGTVGTVTFCRSGTGTFLKCNQNSSHRHSLKLCTLIDFLHLTFLSNTFYYKFNATNPEKIFYPISCDQGMEEKAAAAVIAEEEEGEWLSIRQREELALQVRP
jgi:hypothetical protein